MKHLKTLGLGAAAAMVLTAFGAGNASATTIENGTSPFGHPTIIDASLTGTATLETTGGTTIFSCTGGTIEGEASTGSATETVSGSIATANLTWSGCSSTFTTTQGGDLEIHHIAGTSNGTVTARTFEFTVVAFGVSCTFGFSSSSTMKHLGTLVGDDHTASMNINTIIFERTEDKFLCPNEARWTANYHVTTPTGLTVTAG
jgi:hypothetical protein